MKIILINCFPNLEQNRTEPIRKYLLKNNHEVKMITSDFDHFRKKSIFFDDPSILQVTVPKYKNNLSIKRLFSHYVFSKMVYQILREENPDLIYAKIPPNSLVKYVFKFKKINKLTKIIFDVYDLWPESLPLNKWYFKPFFLLWKNLRDNHLFVADKIITECELYKDKLNLSDAQVVYLGQTDYQNFRVTVIQKHEVLNFCYLGNISHLIDIELTIDFLKKVNENKKIFVHVIGGGKNENKLLYLLDANGINYGFYGMIFDEDKKIQIMNSCQFGLNIMKQDLMVGLSNKSVEYFKTGLILINSVGFDTKKIINQFSSGFSITNENVKKIAMKISGLSNEEIHNLKMNSRNTFLKLFSEKVFINNIENIFKKIIEEFDNKEEF